MSGFSETASHMKSIACLGTSNLLPFTPFFKSETTKLSNLGLNLGKACLSRILDMMYTEMSQVTIVKVKTLVADI